MKHPQDGDDCSIRRLLLRVSKIEKKNFFLCLHKLISRCDFQILGISKLVTRSKCPFRKFNIKTIFSRSYIGKKK